MIQNAKSKLEAIRHAPEKAKGIPKGARPGEEAAAIRNWLTSALGNTKYGSAH
jgi:hypothetical protein